ncbi:MAG: hypothetical protein K2K17_00095, partial [Lachnospiraceae bacterium]|nr:hypothetical protein [Lachnospiraceae bacterium]
VGKAASETDNTRKIPKKYIVRTFTLSLSVLAAILLLAIYIPGIQIQQSARNSYYQGDYMEAFLGMYGRERSESDQLIYESARTIVLLQRKYDSYLNNKAMHLDYQAVDALIQGVGKYEELLSEAERLGVVSQLNEVRAKMESAMMADYLLTWDEAREILKYDALDYTNKLYSLVDGTPFSFKADEINAIYGLPVSSAADSVVPEGDGFTGEIQNETMPDVLPEEESYINQLDETDTESTEPEAEVEPAPVQTVPAEGSINGNPVDVQIESNQF